MSVAANRYASFFAAVLVATFGMSACQSAATRPVDATPAPHRVVAGDAKGVIELSVGQLLEVPLYGNASTGYSWDRIGDQGGVLVDAGSAALIDPAAKHSAAVPGAVGAGNTDIYRFRAARAGEETLTLVYRRSWQPEVPPADTVTLAVRVR